jgi:superfamily II DNA or RNA helicase
MEAVTAILNAWKKHRSCMTTIATGGGKTLVAASTSAAVQHSGRILFLANRNELCLQPLEVFQEQTGIIPGLEKATYRAPLESQIVIGSVQTLCRQKRLERFPRDHFSFIFADEAHMSAADSWRRIFDYFNTARLCGITATPFRSDSKKLTDIFEIEAYRKDLLSLVGDGYLVSPDHVDQLETAISLDNVRLKKTAEGVDYDLEEAASAIEPYFDSIAKELVQKHADKHILAFLPLIASSQKFVAACVANGLNAVHVDGEDPGREEKLEAFKAGRITLLSNSNLLHTGIDIPICNATLCLRPTRSKVLYVQIVGRSTRTVPGLIDGIETQGGRLEAIARSAKPQAFVIDPLWLSKDMSLCIPAFLVAENEEFAAEMQKRAGKSYSLTDTMRAIQREREEAILRRARAVASFRNGQVTAEYFAAATHNQGLLSYEPVYAWEGRPPSRFTKLRLEQAGIDPQSVSCEGQAREAIRLVNVRRYQERAEIRYLGALAAHDETLPLEELWNLSAEDVEERLK